MKVDKPDKQFFKQLGSVKLSETKRQAAWEELSAYADLHTAILPVASSWVWWQASYVRVAGAALALFLMIGGGTAWAAQAALPNTPLYAVKLHINEPVRQALAVSQTAKAELATKLLAERITEATALSASGDLTGETEVATQARIELYAERADQLAADTNASVTVALRGTIDHLLAQSSAETGIQFSPQLARRPSTAHDALANAGGGSSAAHPMSGSQGGAMGMAADQSVSSKVSFVAPEASDTVVDGTTAQHRINAWVRVIEAHATEFDDELQVELNTKLSEAAQFAAVLKIHPTDKVATQEIASRLREVAELVSRVADITYDETMGDVVDLQVKAHVETGVTSFAECVAAGNAVMETYPEQCRVGDTTYINPEQLNHPLETTPPEPTGAKEDTGVSLPSLPVSF